VDERRPPPDITPAHFFQTWLPDAYRAADCRAPLDPWTVAVTLSGEGGGQWELEPSEDQLTVREAAIPADPRAARLTAPRANLWIRQSTADFLAVLVGDPDLPDLLPASMGPLELLFLDPRDRDLVRQIDGRLAVEVAGRRRRRWTLDLAVGKAGLAAGRPRATVRVDAATYEGLREGKLPPLQALLERKLAVEGDRPLAMQALVLLASRLNRG
jgi:hypothetical protein